MKIFLTSVFVFLTINLAYADDRHSGGHSGGNHGDGGRWVGPALIGAFIGYELAMPRTIYVQPAPRQS